MISAAGLRPRYDFGKIEFRHAHKITVPLYVLHGKWTTAPKLIDVFNTHTHTPHYLYEYTPLKLHAV